MNWIQNHILLELTRHSVRRYSELRPCDIEGNLFMYHLKGLIKDKLVEKNEAGYRLSVKGMQFAGTLSLKTGKTRQQPKILTAVACTNEAGEHLFVKWHRQPNIGQISFPHGMVHFGESIFDMAALELAEKAGLVGELVYRGEVYVRGMLEGAVDRHMLVHLFAANNLHVGRQDEMRPEVCESFWAPLKDMKPEEFVPGFYEIAQIIQRENGRIFKEVTVDINRYQA